MHQQRLAGRKRRSGSERLQGGLINHKNGRSGQGKQHANLPGA